VKFVKCSVALSYVDVIYTCKFYGHKHAIASVSVLEL